MTVMILNMDIGKDWLPVNTQMYFWVAVCDRGSAFVRFCSCMYVGVSCGKTLVSCVD